MSKYIGDYDTTVILNEKFTTYSPNTGIPTILVNGAIAVFKDDDPAYELGGITLIIDMIPTLPGLNHVKIEVTPSSFYTAGSSYQVVLGAGSCDGVDIYGSVLFSFSIKKTYNPVTPPTDLNPVLDRLPAALVGGRMDSSIGTYQSGTSPLQPTVPGRTIDVTIGGAVGIDWGNIENITTVQNLQNTQLYRVANVDIVNTTLNSTNVTNVLNPVIVGDKTGFSLSIPGVNAVRDSILSDGTKFAGAYIDVPISSVSSGSGDDGDITSIQGSVPAATNLRDFFITALGTAVAANLDVPVSSVSGSGDETDLTPVLERLPVSLINGKMDSVVQNPVNTPGDITLMERLTVLRAENLDKLDVPISSRGTSNYNGGSVQSVTDPVVVGVNQDKIGYELSSASSGAIVRSRPATELENIPGPTAEMLEMIQFVYEYFRNKRVLSKPGNSETLYKENGADPLGSAQISDDGSIFIKNKIG